MHGRAYPSLLYDVKSSPLLWIDAVVSRTCLDRTFHDLLMRALAAPTKRHRCAPTMLILSPVDPRVPGERRCAEVSWGMGGTPHLRCIHTEGGGS
jgi:hypothetical protein